MCAEDCQEVIIRCSEINYLIVCNIVIYADDTTCYYKCDQASYLWQQLELASELEGSGLLISVLEKLNWFCLTGLITLVLLI